MEFHNEQNLRLEIEVPGTGLPNLVQNPSGEKGAFGWVTPVANTTMASETTPTQRLKFQTTAAQAAYVQTELMPVAAGRYVAARFDTTGITSSGATIRARLDFYNSSKVLLSSSPYTAYLTIASNTYYLPIINAPTNTLYVALRIDLYSNGSGGTPVAGQYFYIKNAMVTATDTYAEISGGGRKNLINNPSFETNTTGWTAYSGSSISRVSSPTPQVGSWAASITKITSAGQGAMNSTTGTGGIPIVGSKKYTYSFYVRTTAARSVGMWITYYDSAGANPVTLSASTILTTTANTWTRVSYTHTAYSDKAFVALYPVINGMSVNEVAYIDGVLIEEGDTLGTYFDGNTSGYVWTGTANNSTSVSSTTVPIAYSEPVNWRNVLGPTHEITIDRTAMDVGLMSAVILDPALDPASYPEVRPGKKVRIQSLVSGVWTHLYEGKTTNANVEYVREKKVNAETQTRITLTASDATSALANQTESRGVESIDSLPFILEGAGVPWSINGSGNQVASATVVSNQPDATLLDQVAITRDTKLGYAWVNKKNILCVFDSNKMASTSSQVLTDLIPSLASVNNGGFEDTNISDWKGGDYAGSTYPVLSRDTTIKKSGLASLKAVTGGNQGEVIYNRNAATVVPGELYQFSVDVRAPALVGTTKDYFVRLEVYAYNPTTNAYYFLGSQTIDETINPNPSNTWVTLTTGPFVFPEGYSQIDVEVGFTDWNGYGVAQTLYIDNVQSILATGLLSFTDIEAGYNTDDCINEVVVKWIQSTGNEVVYGPYIDQTSIDKWGPKSAEFTIHGATESSSAIATYGTNILNKNKNPVTMVRSVRVPVRNAAEMAFASSLELYDTIQVLFAGKISAYYRVYSINHNITPTEWTVDLEFVPTGTVAFPTRSV